MIGKIQNGGSSGARAAGSANSITPSGAKSRAAELAVKMFVPLFLDQSRQKTVTFPGSDLTF